MWRIRYALEQGDRLRALPALARDVGASLVVLAAFGAAASFPFVAVPAAALVEELRRSRAEAEMAHFRVETIARRAAERIEAARRLAPEADERLVEAERRAFSAARAMASPPPPHANAPDPAMESAFRSEGGI
jgi:imidazolonepropionase-like amidohydrolase